MKKYFWPIALLVLIAFRQMAGSTVLETFYSRGLYPFLHRVLGFASAISPIPLIYLLWFGTLVFLAIRFRQWRRVSAGRRRKVLLLLRGTCSFLSAVAFFFLLLWGLNYGRQPVEKRLDLQVRPLDKGELLSEYRRLVDSLSVERQALQQKYPPLSDTSTWVVPPVAETLIREALEKVLSEQGYPVGLHIRLRELYPGTLLHMGTAGVYLAWSGEGHYDGGLHSLQKPFVMAHEMAHGYGFGDEGICNFWAWLACTRSENLLLRYSARLAYWRYVRAALQRLSPETFRQAEEHLPKGLQNDLMAIQRQMARYPDILPQWRNLVYETYLKSQGVKEGLKSYSRLPMLIKAWQLKKQKD